MPNNPNPQQKHQRRSLIKGILNFGKNTLLNISEKFLEIGGQQQQTDYQMIAYNDQEVVASALEEINYYMINISVKPDIASEIIIDLSFKNQIEEHIMQHLLKKQFNKKFTEVQQAINENNKNKLNFAKWQRQNKKYGSLFFGMISALPFSTKKDCLTLLTVNKKWYSILKMKIYKNFLNHQIINQSQRIQFWLSIINQNCQKISYSNQLKLLETTKLTSYIEDVIKLDVQRSLSIHKENITHETLASLLQAFAIQDAQISYCQGMNYIMGFLYLLLRDNDITLNTFNALMHNYFDGLFLKDMPGLKKLFYQFEKCVMIYLPELANHFNVNFFNFYCLCIIKIERIDANYYVSPWFITIFTNVFQSVQSSYFLMQIWDIFIQYKWKGLFKICLYLLECYEPQLLHMHFDDLLHFLNELGHGALFEIPVDFDLKIETDPIKIYNFAIISKMKEKIQNIELTNLILDVLDNEYKEVIIKVEEKIVTSKKLFNQLLK